MLLVLTLAVSGGLLAWHGLHRTSASPPAGQTQTPAVPAPPEAVPDTVSTLCVAGDLVMHIPIINSCRTDDGYDFTGLFDEARPYYESADYAAACIETTFNGPPYSGFPQFCAPDQLAGDLKSVGLDLLSTASNHSLDTWFSGLTRTLDVLDGAGLDHVGTYRTQGGARHGEGHRRRRHPSRRPRLYLRHERSAEGRASVLRQCFLRPIT